MRTESLETRVFLHGDGLDDELHAHGNVNVVLNDPAEVDSGDGSLISAAFALTSLPVLNSLAGAAASLYLDFNGHFDAVWGGYSNISTPVFDQDGDMTTFSQGELDTIYNIWLAMSEDFSPFQINVTTAEPPSFANGVALRVAIGGGGAWTGGTYGGISYINSFTNSVVNTAYVFSDNLANGNAKYTADASSHEAGHALGLLHQSQYSGSTKTAEYYVGPGDGTAPLMGSSYYATRSLWWYGTSTSSSAMQDDMAILARSANGFGYRADDHANSAASATALAVSGDQLAGSGVIHATSDVDYFSFSTGGGQVSFSVSVGAFTNLDSRLELRSASGSLIASAAPTNSFGATLSTTLAAGSYRLVVASNGGYGNVGQYWVSGTVPAVLATVASPSGLSAAVGSGQVNLAWTDNATNETQYYVDRSTDAVTWSTAATLAAGSTSYADIDTQAGATLRYRVWAVGASATSDFSNIGVVTLVPDAPSGLSATAISSKQINLAWNDVAGETGYTVQRSANGGTTWSDVASLSANVTSYQNTSLAANTTYQYRVVAKNAGGNSAPSSVAAATTLPVPTAPVAPSGLTVVAPTSKQVVLTWQDNSTNESGFRVQRSSDGGKTYKTLTEISADETSFTDTTAKGSKTYRYRVRAFNEVGNSAYSAVFKIKTPPPAPVAAPTELTATTISSAQVNLSWSDNADNEDGYRVYRSSDGGKSWSKRATLGADVTAYSDTSVKKGKTYLYRVRGFGEAGNTVYTSVAQAVVPSASLAIASAQRASGMSAIVASAALAAHNMQGASNGQLVASAFADANWVNALLASRARLYF